MALVAGGAAGGTLALVFAVATVAVALLSSAAGQLLLPVAAGCSFTVTMTMLYAVLLVLFHQWRVLADNGLVQVADVGGYQLAQDGGNAVSRSLPGVVVVVLSRCKMQ